jgi:hypothetical protein
MVGVQGFSEDFANKILDHVTGKTALGQPTRIDVALFNTCPGEDGSGVEMTGTGYVRAQTTPAGHWATPALAGVISNSAQIAFPAAGAGDWLTASWFALYAIIGGSTYFMGYGELSDAPVTISAGDTPVFNATTLEVSLTQGFLSAYATKILNHVFGGAALAVTTQLAVALYDAAGSELAGNAYARVTTLPADWAAGSASSTANTSQVTFPTATPGDWSDSKYYGLIDQDANLVVKEELADLKTIDASDTARFTVGDLVINLD